MTVNPTQTTCPSCSSIYVTALESGTFFCAECRHEWDPKAVPVISESTPPDDLAQLLIDSLRAKRPRTGGRPGGDTPPDEGRPGGDTPPGESFVTFVDVEHDDGGSGNWRTDRYTYVTAEPHSRARAEIEATDHYLHEVGSGVRSVKAAGSNFDAPAIAEQAHEDNTARELEDLIAQTDADAEAYLASLIGAGVTLEGGQRATILGFGDDDQIVVQLSTGDTATVDFNDVIGADSGLPAGEIVDTELDDETAEAFGAAALLMACLVIEAGLASVSGDGADAHLVEPPTDWFLPDVDAIPLMEQASAAAVALLIQTFALPRDVIAATIATVRTGIEPITTTEDKGYDEHTGIDGGEFPAGTDD